MRPVEFSRLFNPAKIEPRLTAQFPVISRDDYSRSKLLVPMMDNVDKMKGDIMCGVCSEYLEKLKSLSEYDLILKRDQIEVTSPSRVDD